MQANFHHTGSGLDAKLWPQGIAGAEAICNSALALLDSDSLRIRALQRSLFLSSFLGLDLFDLLLRWWRRNRVHIQQLLQRWSAAWSQLQSLLQRKHGMSYRDGILKKMRLGRVKAIDFQEMAQRPRRESTLLLKAELLDQSRQITNICTVLADYTARLRTNPPLGNINVPFQVDVLSLSATVGTCGG